MKGGFGDNAVFRTSVPVGVGLTVLVGCLVTAFVLRKGGRQFFTQKQQQRNRNELERENGETNIGNCYVCSVALDPSDPSSHTKCAGCTQPICVQQQRGCAIRLPAATSDAAWNCKLCNSFLSGTQTACDWFMRKINRRLRQHSESVSAADNVGLAWNANDATIVVPAEQRDVVRNYMERLVASMLGGSKKDADSDAGSLDRVPIGQLSTSENYLSLFAQYHLPLSRIFHSLEKSIHLRLCLPQRQQQLQALHHGDQRSSLAAQPPPVDIDAYDNLRRLVEQIIEQVFRLPELLDCSGVSPSGQQAPPPRPAEFDPKKYEELLATAVLNRIVEKFEREQKILRDRRDFIEHRNEWSGSSSPSDYSSDIPRSESSSSGDQSHGQQRRHRPMSLNVENTAPSFSSSNNINSDSTVPLAGPQSPTSDEEYLSDYIQNHRIPLPQLGTEDGDVQPNPDDQFHSFTSATSLNGINATATAATDNNNDGKSATASDEAVWQNNWLFRKRASPDNDDHDDDASSTGLASITSSVTNSTSVGMLVPSPTEDVKTLIGDRTADEVSDLSEAGSDVESELSDAEPLATNHVDIPHVIVQSKTLIGGKNEVESFDLLGTMNEASDNFNEPTNSDVEHSLQTLDEVVSNAEATLAPVVVDVVPKVIVDADTPVPAPRKYSLPGGLQSGGSIAEREHTKWENVPDVPGNPYSPAELQKRLSTQSLHREADLIRLSNVDHDDVSTAGTPDRLPTPVASPVSKPDISRYGRDYYINHAKHATGKTPNSTIDDDADEWLSIGDTTATVAESVPIESSNKSAEYELHTATVYVNISADNDNDNNHPTHSFAITGDLLNLSASDEPTSLSHSSLTPSEASDTTRIYDLSSRQTSLLHNDTRLCAPEPTTPSPPSPPPPTTQPNTTAVVSASDPSPSTAAAFHDADALEARRTSLATARRRYLDERSTSFEQLEQFKRAIEKTNQPISVTVKPLSSAQRYFGVVDTSTHQSAAPPAAPIRAKRKAVIGRSATMEEQSSWTNEAASISIPIEHSSTDRQPVVSAEQVPQEQKHDDEPEHIIDDAVAGTHEAPDENHPVEETFPDVAIVEELTKPAVLIDEAADVEVHHASAEEHVHDAEYAEMINGGQLSYNEPIIVGKASVIEEDVLPALPSVKALARSFINLQTASDESLTLTPINRPKSLNWVNNNNNNSHEHDHHNDAESIAAAAADQQDDATTTFPLYTQKYHPAAVHSITARNLSSRVRDELKGTSESSRGRSSPDRPVSPVLVPGLLKNNIAFFENLNK